MIIGPATSYRLTGPALKNQSVLVGSERSVYISAQSLVRKMCATRQRLAATSSTKGRTLSAVGRCRAMAKPSNGDPCRATFSAVRKLDQYLNAALTADMR